MHVCVDVFFIEKLTGMHLGAERRDHLPPLQFEHELLASTENVPFGHAAQLFAPVEDE